MKARFNLLRFSIVFYCVNIQVKQHNNEVGKGHQLKFEFTMACVSWKKVESFAPSNGHGSTRYEAAVHYHPTVHHSTIPTAHRHRILCRLQSATVVGDGNPEGHRSSGTSSSILHPLVELHFLLLPAINRPTMCCV
ncbi:hypothetical protein GCK32_002869 [Trichostrongylus colubriformis]|uniref:Uncharacterized protein n=1 Tax=Trichostrongylus colubriformis TaxID=6319 RepID=A0AAN8EX13_TRICO